VEAPVVAPCEQACQSASIFAQLGILTALFSRMTTGKGQHIDISSHEVMAAINEGLITKYSNQIDLGQRTGSQFATCPSRIYPCNDGYVHIVILRPEHWRNFLEVIGNPEILSDDVWYDMNFRQQNADLIDPIVTEFTLSHTQKEIIEILQERRIPCTPFYTPSDFCRDAHVKQRSFIIEVEHPVIGRHSYLSPPYRFSQTPCRVECPAPLLGQHNDEIYRGQLGYSEDDLARFRAEGAI
jgi:crotonobetainyl-CoA:carnitine CoA-transferase CaiB-like acyl-CoA transferase